LLVEPEHGVLETPAQTLSVMNRAVLDEVLNVRRRYPVRSQRPDDRGGSL
jgi:hypothetical protein